MFVAHCHSSQERQSHHSEAMKKNLITRMNRIEGQIRGIHSLIMKETYCDDVLTQISSASSALNSVSKILLEEHMKSCVIERLADGETEVIEEVISTVRDLLQSKSAVLPGDEGTLDSHLTTLGERARKIKELISEDTYCNTVLSHIASLQSGLQGVSEKLLQQHMKICLGERLQNNDAEAIRDMMITVKKLMK